MPGETYTPKKCPHVDDYARAFLPVAAGVNVYFKGRTEHWDAICGPCLEKVERGEVKEHHAGD